MTRSQKNDRLVRIFLAMSIEQFVGVMVTPAMQCTAGRGAKNSSLSARQV